MNLHELQTRVAMSAKLVINHFPLNVLWRIDQECKDVKRLSNAYVNFLLFSNWFSKLHKFRLCFQNTYAKHTPVPLFLTSPWLVFQVCYKCSETHYLCSGTFQQGFCNFFLKNKYDSNFFMTSWDLSHQPGISFGSFHKCLLFSVCKCKIIVFFCSVNSNTNVGIIHWI